MGFMPQMVDAVIDGLFEAQPADKPVVTAKDASNREFSRIPFHGRAAAIIFPLPCSPYSEPLESEVLTTDISRGGLSLLYQQELCPGQQVLLQLSQGGCTVEVCWCCQVWPGLYIAGCRFLDAMLTDCSS
ncbi:MAG: PilZ domain-containing protein [Pirellulaceae bacterium]